ncbi:HNH endonuclease [Curtobacterium sp. Csp1]|uniref:HNH endonuclease n=1 Tax=unclassified Curtobacterium TaxID=257496 RepID=UPI001597410F|nr:MULTISPECIES: HNH endonuclease [unclassified Curtobacterium]QKS13193.1 HNH endonuclease [Curtobacterium sp. csp3]QKS19416.1 HNH endonuclease [Curtobacterium sp. Csp1]
MNRTLVLNASYEPIAVVAPRRALALVMNGKASVVLDGEATLHSARLAVAEPSVVLLRQFVRIPRRSVPLTRRSALEAYDYTCAYCLGFGDTLDHVVPRARGGEHAWSNVVVACFQCNNKKADRLLQEIGWKLALDLREPAPNTASLIRKRWRQPEWMQFTDPWDRYTLPLAG